MLGPIPFVLDFTSGPPSNGAHMLAWWGGQDADRWDRFGAALAERSGWIEDLLLGDVEPSPRMAQSIAGMTQGVVPAEQWDCGCCLDWRDKPLGWAGPPGRYAPCAPASAGEA
ncbi:hypothetical protein HZY97_16140 [Sphingomonas sp. R-74633]|uniref:hypothetical protein n=1 Tax=Sphingomonas sp. R-74633 TaxID=2751188 RepID=UPI0015D45D75|nr:hypothetical protein [Sphingomonas sp. R-74633]NYT42303.1 hypothetical protein [Sphingomonas sp. R-74633]